MPLTMVGVGESQPILHIGGSDKVRILKTSAFVEGRKRFAWFPILPATLIVQVKRCARGHQPRIGDQGFWSAFPSGRNRAYRRRISDDTEEEAGIGSTHGGHEGRRRGRAQAPHQDMGITKGVQDLCSQGGAWATGGRLTVRGCTRRTPYMLRKTRRIRLISG